MPPPEPECRCKHNNDVSNHPRAVGATLKTLDNDRAPQPAHVFSTVQPVAQIPGRVQSYGQREASRRNRGHSEKQGSDARSEERVLPCRAAGNVLNRKDKSDNELCGQEAKERVEPSERIAMERQFLPARQQDIHDHRCRDFGKTYAFRTDPSDVSRQSLDRHVRRYQEDAEEKANAKAQRTLSADCSADVFEPQALPSHECYRQHKSREAGNSRSEQSGWQSMNLSLDGRGRCQQYGAQNEEEQYAT